MADEPVTPDNMRIWSQVERTDPSHTKKVNQRGGFTAISAHYQIMRATEVFGPIGIGWGYTAGEPTVLADRLVFIPVTLWHGHRENTFGPIYGGAEIIDNKGRLDQDAAKKATTDGLTKALSQLGFNADVFLGKYDNADYIEAMEGEFAGSGYITAEQAAEVKALIEEVKADVPRFLRHMKVASIEAIPDHAFKKAIASLNLKKKAAKND